jgi:hypothetical protein
MEVQLRHESNKEAGGLFSLQVPTIHVAEPKTDAEPKSQNVARSELALFSPDAVINGGYLEKYVVIAPLPCSGHICKAI